MTRGNGNLGGINIIRLPGTYDAKTDENQTPLPSIILLLDNLATRLLRETCKRKNVY